LKSVGRHQEAIAELKRAVELAPLSPSANVFVGRVYFGARRYDEAIAQCPARISQWPVPSSWRAFMPGSIAAMKPSPCDCAHPAQFVSPPPFPAARPRDSAGCGLARPLLSLGSNPNRRAIQ
jgi:hypothetical protein